jgi:phage shock protein C
MANKIYRSRNHKMIAGVAGGIAEYFDIDPVLVRAGLILSVLCWGGGILLYFIFWIIIPFRTMEQVGVSADGIPIGKESDFIDINDELDIRHKEKRKTIFGILLIVLGAFMLLDNILPNFNFEDWWPILLIIIGIYFLVNALIIKKK